MANGCIIAAVIIISLATIIVITGVTLAIVFDDRVQTTPIPAPSPPPPPMPPVNAPVEADMLQMEAIIVQRAAERGTIDCLDFMADSLANAGARVLMRQECFDSGTFRATQPGDYVFVEDVVFNPNADRDSRVTPQQRASGAYPKHSGYTLGFFAAIEIAANDVRINLNGYQLSQSRLHNLKQRFFSLIEIASACFIPGEGPDDFGDTFFAPQRVVIGGGDMGSTVHHGIHTNGPRFVYIKDLTLRDYQVAAIALNGVTDVMIKRVRALGTDQRIPVTGAFSQARFLLPLLERHARDDPALGPVYERLLTLHDQVVDDVLANNFVDERNHTEAYRLFANEDELADGSVAYGFVITNLGAAVNAFDRDFVEQGSSQRVTIDECQIQRTVSAAKEVVAYVRVPYDPANPQVVRGPFGDVVNFQRVAEAGSIDGDALTQAHFVYAGAVRRAAARGIEFERGGTLFVPDPLLDWYEASEDGGSLSDPAFAAAIRASSLRVARNGDPMFHVAKGPVALRIDGSRDVLVTNLEILGVTAAGAAAHTTLLPGEDPATQWRAECGDTGLCYTNVDGGHPEQAHMVGYGGNIARGILLGGVRNVVVDPNTVSIEGVVSYTGVAIDFDDGTAQNTLARSIAVEAQ